MLLLLLLLIFIESLPSEVDVSDYVASGAASIELHIEAQDTYGNRDTSDLSFTC